MDETALTADEINLYDRQIRLWGMEAQTNLRNSNILVINLTGLGVEIVKNLTLGGIGSLTILDDSELKEQDLDSNFFVTYDQIGLLKVNAAKEKIQDMNPRVKLNIDSRYWEELKIEEFKKFQIIVATGLNSLQISKLNKISRDLNIPFISCCVHGMYGFIFNDLIKCKNWITLEKNENRKIGEFNLVSNILEIEDIIENDLEKQKILVENEYRKWDELSGQYLNKQFPTDKKKKKKINSTLISILALLELSDKYLNLEIEKVSISNEELKDKITIILNKLELPNNIQMNEEEIERFLRHAYCEYQPTNSIIGGVVSQDIINILVQKELPINNVSILDGFKSEMPVYNL
jgi:ubiquitin-like 1-activating enzyme E1 A